jgi:hypothetical protein
MSVGSVEITPGSYRGSAPSGNLLQTREIDARPELIDDGEIGKSSWNTCLYERTNGI